MTSPKLEPEKLFDAKYYQTGLGLPYERSDHWLNFFGGIADQIIRSLRPRTVLDVGCALGFLVEGLWDRGIPSYGFDISSFAIAQVRRDIQPYCRQASILEPIAGRYDLITCIEVLEHLHPEETTAAIANLASASDAILFSSSPTDLTESTHFNVRPTIGWLKLFAEAGFWPDALFDASFVAPHAILLRKQQPSSEETLSLFSEKTRLKCALVEREQRIGSLNESLAQLKTQVEANPGVSEAARSEIARLARDVDILRAESESFRHENTRLLTETEQLRSERDRLVSESGPIQQQLVGLRGKVKRLLDEKNKVADALRQVRDENEQLSRRLLDYSSRLQESTTRALVLHTELEDSRHQGRLLSAEIAHINRSAAWQVTQRYRAWVENRRAGSSLIRAYDRTAKWLIHIVKPSKTSRPSEPASVSEQIEKAPVVQSEVQGAAEISLSIQEVESYESWYRRTEPGPKELEFQKALSRNLRLQPLLSVLVPVYSVPIRVLEEMVASVREQSYPYWELCIVHGYPADEEGRAFLASEAAEDSRIKVRLLEKNQGISGNSNAALELVQGDFVVLLDHDDTLAPFALFQIASAINENPEVGFLYSDKDCISDDGKQRLRPLFKPQWSPEIMLCANYLTHLSVMRTSLVRKAGGWKSETDGAQDWDIFLRVLDLGAKVCHVPGILYHWRIISTSVASGGLEAKPYVTQGQISTLDAHSQRLGLTADVDIDNRGICKMNWNGVEDHSVSIMIVPSSDSGVSAKHSLHSCPAALWPGVQIVSVDTVPYDEQEPLVVWLNRAVKVTKSDYLVFIDESVVVRQHDWLRELVGPLQQHDVAIVGPKLINPVDGSLQHAGIVFNSDGSADSIFSQEPEHVYEQFGSANWYRNWSAVTGACFAIRRKSFDNVGGFQDNPAYPRHDIDLCLRVRTQTGNRIVYNPFARLFQSRHAKLETWLSPGGPQAGAAYIRECFATGDPYFNQDLQCRSGKVLFASNKSSTTVSDYTAEARALVGFFDATSDTVESSKTLTIGPLTHTFKHLTWILPQFVHPFYGGVHTILRFAEYFRRQHGVRSEFVFSGSVPEQVIAERIALAFPELALESGVINLRSYADFDRVHCSDAAISTLWTTAYSALHFKNTRKKFYFIQDYESGFYPAGSTYGLVEATYRFGFHGICNTRSLAEMYREFGGTAEYFNPCIDPQYFFEPKEKGAQRQPFRIFCYARPGHPRNCFELLIASLTKLKQRLGDQVEILSAGSQWSPSEFGLEGVVENLGLISYSATGALYRTCDAGVVLMMTRHPSYLPMELMACGSLVITNQNRYTQWLLKHEQNCLLSETTASAFADTIERGLIERNLRMNITRKASEQIRAEYSDWNLEAEKMFRYIVANV